MYGGSYKIHCTDTNFKRRLRKNHASPSKSETCSGLCMESGSWDMLKLKRKEKNKIDQNLLYGVTQYRNPRSKIRPGSVGINSRSLKYRSISSIPVQGSVDWQARKRATDDSALCACGASGDRRYNITNCPGIGCTSCTYNNR